MAYGGFKDLARTVSDRALHDKASEITPKYDGYQRGLNFGLQFF